MAEVVKNPQKSKAKRFIEFLGSMELAITLLSALAVASVIGTILQQNQSYNDYRLKFGLFWFEVFEKIALYDVYAAIWFLSILGFLILSTSVCVYRNAPVFLREARRFRTNVQLKSLQSFKHQKQWQVDKPADEVMSMGAAFFNYLGLKSRSTVAQQHRLIAAKKGGINRWGYILTHAGVIIICIGALFDSKIPMMIAEWSGNLKPETRNISASEVPDISRIAPGNASFRGNVQIPEGGKANIVFLNVRDGYVVQELPFAIELKDFRVEHYSTGAPKSFESDLIIHDDQLQKPLEATIAVNHPLVYRGFALYQASFADGGTKLDLALWSLSDKPGSVINKKTEIFDSFNLSTAGETLSAEMTDFRLFNINGVMQDDGSTKQTNIGPSISFKLRDASGVAKEFVNYMLPVTSEGISSYLSGVRSDPTQPFQYLHLPVAEGGVAQFMQLLERLSDEKTVETAAILTVSRTMGKALIKDQKLAADISGSMLNLVALFVSGGYEAVVNDVKGRVPEDKQKEVIETYLKLLQSVAATVYETMLSEKGHKTITEGDWQWFDLALQALNTLPYYGSPIYVEMKSYQHIQAAGIQITKSPGQNIVYFGCVLLMIGVFFLFYINPTRYWLWVDQQNAQTRILLAGVSHRHTQDFEKQFDKAVDDFEAALNRKRGE
ncbi:MAG: cytochrome c biogenesis protein ResB [Gammaproteobacteria bacterium]|nr:cytochrome c biogenesis protein ResB [Gammaproteobacteria bacterium]